MSQEAKTVVPIICFKMVSGTQYHVTDIFLHNEELLKRAHALHVNASETLGNKSIGVGLWGSPGWLLLGGIALGMLENTSTQKAISLLDESKNLMVAAKK